jgi:hypothetical protein
LSRQKKKRRGGKSQEEEEKNKFYLYIIFFILASSALLCSALSLVHSVTFAAKFFSVWLFPAGWLAARGSIILHSIWPGAS